MIAPGPMGSYQVVERLVFASSFQDGMLGCFVVTKLDVWGGRSWLEQDWCDDGCPATACELVNGCSRDGGMCPLVTLVV